MRARQIFYLMAESQISLMGELVIFLAQALLFAGPRGLLIAAQFDPPGTYFRD